MIIENEVLAKAENQYHCRLIQEAYLETQRLKNTVELIKKQVEITYQLEQRLKENMHLE